MATLPDERQKNTNIEGLKLYGMLTYVSTETSGYSPVTRYTEEEILFNVDAENSLCVYNNFLHTVKPAQIACTSLRGHGIVYIEPVSEGYSIRIQQNISNGQQTRSGWVRYNMYNVQGYGDLFYSTLQSREIVYHIIEGMSIGVFPMITLATWRRKHD